MEDDFLRTIVAGQNVALPPGPVRFAARGAVAVGALYGIAVLPEAGPGWLSLQHVRSEWVSASGEGAVEVFPDRLPHGVVRVYVGVYARRAATTMRGFLPASFNLGDHGFEIGADEMGSAFLAFAELYRRNGGWKVRARSDWSVAGVVDFARRHGCELPEASEPTVRDPEAPPYPGGRPLTGEWTGSAFLVGDSVAATNAHVVEGAGRIVAVGDAGRFEAEAIVADIGADIALVRVKGCGSSPPITFRTGFDLSSGEQVYAVGFPMSGFLGAGPQITSGMVANSLGPANDTRLLQISAPIQPGSSGGPVFDASGRLVGVAVASLSGAQNVNFAVRAALVSYLAQSVGIDVKSAGADAPFSPDRLLRAVRGSLFKLECSVR